MPAAAPSSDMQDLMQHVDAEAFHDPFPVHRRRNQDLWEWLIAIYRIATDSAGTFAVTVIAWGLTSAVYFASWPTLLPWASFTTGSIYAILMLREIIRIARKGDEFTLTEIGDRIVEMDHELNEKLDLVVRNV
jgi:hypothetical protein